MAAGEIQTEADGTIISITSKSGHYKPSTKENVAMLRWFEERGVDLSKVSFSYFQTNGEEAPIFSAKSYLDLMLSTSARG